MEETVWLYFSVLAIIIALGVVGTLFYRNSDKTQLQHMMRSIEELKSQCDYVCDSGVGTNLPIKVTLPAGLYLYTRQQKICGTFKDSNMCRVCDCTLQDYIMALNTTFAQRVTKTHEYNCYFKRLENGVQMDCQG